MNDKLPKRKTVRIQGFDYASGGGYFVTVCAFERHSLFGRIEDGSIVLSRVGEITQRCWLEILEHFPTVVLDEYAIMPNHFHGILFLTEGEAGTIYRAPTREELGKPVDASLSTIVRTFKAAVTREARASGFLTGKSIWQRGFYEHIIHRDAELAEIRKYIFNNPAQWEFDKENPIIR
jgi:putative transposase